MTPVGTLRYMASLLATSPVEDETSRFLGGDLVIRHEPIGVIAGIVPWNYPQTLASFKYAPALAAGNTIVLKPSPETVLDSYEFAEAVIAANLPPGVINIVPGRPVGRRQGERPRPRARPRRDRRLPEPQDRLRLTGGRASH
jgi:acyl-CoA reductase-like NAD-dependent aldehyde dehydrogenase